MLNFVSTLKAEFVENLIHYRNLKSMSQLELSGICECGKSTISGIESGKTYPSFDLIFRLADALEIHPADLFLRGASESQGAVRTFFDEELAPKMREMVERRFPAHG
jgi:transcriptional regulator with XRE-family HTH domain